ncbi:toll/interleukin-1 receptor domain-containing protein [Bradyrhizobium sp.]|uniref:toll/interleukin-1 receptor domain-containing protein n=1 Tax=Bradyrhizobium sp. TaxID=376 RepID=UPI0029031E5F|nr:toll/interleukin-1 receptor domain-containing protein [Bradyrhizobium sp.]MDU0954813.1 toll/interleukin-1 receptor domain-containing protein [Bradyrhizobium sp.]MDU1493730.1 toll/interleukin-1 receptor domain-containing protein [Bradyrhizobium sp.]MDU1666282.1 toll/interleukin-1 receptor domain-containing protein [Bradyrhizobium sp.]MDU1692254.1 toll/interleukin-1 receptor domain-containing protein [Bradyrhizobium sp.]MDU1804838.1 toll/interleukin-1 receptor domain-containing protein [Brady
MFHDEDEIPSTQDLSEEIRSALARSDHLIIICSPDTPASKWVRREISLFQEMGKGDRILPLLIAGQPEDSFPPELRQRRQVFTNPDGTERVTFEEIKPVAADVRPRQDETRKSTERRALLRLAAGLIGCRYDDLARRDEERARAAFRKKLYATAASLVIALLGGWWTWDTYYAFKTQYCAATIEKFGVPECLAELTPAEWQASLSWRLTSQGGRLLEKARVNGLGIPVSWQETDALPSLEDL